MDTLDEKGMWNHIKKYAKDAGYALIKNVLILYYAFPEASASDKAVIIGAIAYFVSPIDAIADFLPGGFVDDAGVVAGAVAKIRLSASSGVISKAENKCREWFA